MESDYLMGINIANFFALNYSREAFYYVKSL